MFKFAAGVAYRGTQYFGWQKQSHSDNTAQFHIEHALSQVADHSIEVLCAGRTDSGVHASGQVIHFSTQAVRTPYSWQMGTNTHLPTDIRLNWVCEVHEDFHARFSAKYRRYHYVIADENFGDAIFHDLLTPCRYKLNVDKMNQAAQCLIGEQDFSSFRAAQCQSNSPYRHIDFVNVYRLPNNGFIVVDIQANAFLYHMVRNIVGALLVVGKEQQPVAWLHQVLSEKDRTKAPATAPAQGLYLVDVGYDDSHQLPQNRLYCPFA